jgi:hypothetical protein
VGELQPISALCRRSLGGEGARRIVAAWQGSSVPWRIAGVVTVSVLLVIPIAVGVALFSSPDWGGKLAGVAAGIAVLYAGYQVRLTRSIAKQTLSYQYFERFSKYSLEDSYVRAKTFVFPPPGDKAEEQRRWDRFKHWEKSDPSKASDLIFILNFFEELGGVYKRGVVDRQVIREYLGKFAFAFWKQLDWFVPRIREDRSAPTLYEDWEAMCKAVEHGKKHEERLRKRFP